MTQPTKSTAEKSFIVLWDDRMGVTCPMGWDADCAGAICCWTDHIAVFRSRKDARKAIDISTKYALICRAKGESANGDFLCESRKNLRIVPCVST